MSDDRPTASAVPIPEEQPDDIQRADQARSHQLEPIYQCPDCHQPLERQEVHQRVVLSEVRFRPAHMMHNEHQTPLLVFYGCTNPLCRHMFWKPPQKYCPTRRH